MNIISSNISNCILFIYMLYEKKSKLKTFFGEVLSKHLIYVSNSFDWACIFFIFIKFETSNLFRSILLALDSLILSNTFFLCREIRHEDSFIHVLFLCVFLLYHFVMFLVCISYLFTACQVRGRFLRPPPPPLPVLSWLTHPFSLIC